MRTGYRFAVGAGVLLVFALTVARVIELTTHIGNDDVITAAFSSTIAVVIALIAAGHFRNGA